MQREGKSQSNSKSKSKGSVKSRLLTNRDKDILLFINRFGFCEMPHLNRQFQFSAVSRRNYKVVGRLVESGLLHHEQAFHKQHGTYRLTKKGAAYSPLPPLKKMRYDTYEHEVILIELYFSLMARHTEAEWVSERELRHEKFCEGIGKSGHVPDGVMIFPDEKKIAIELERTRKGNVRLRKILRQYATSEIEEVWYFCTRRVAMSLRMSEIVQKFTFIKVYALEEAGLAES